MLRQENVLSIKFEIKKNWKGQLIERPVDVFEKDFTSFNYSLQLKDQGSIRKCISAEIYLSNFHVANVVPVLSGNV